MLSYEEKKAIERIEDFLTTNIIVSISNNETANSEELKVFISKNEYLAIEFIASMFLKQSIEIEELKNITKSYDSFLGDEKIVIADKKFFVNGYFQENFVRKDKIKAKIEEFKIVRDTILENEKEFNKPMMTYDYCEKMLQSLLEKEEKI